VSGVHSRTAARIASHPSQVIVATTTPATNACLGFEPNSSLASARRRY
jgi:hypothetical protein